jgi:hypothetical protein
MKEVVHKKSDGCGNEMRITQDKAAPPWVFEIGLYIHREGRTKTIGILNAKDRVLFLTRTKARHLHFKSNSYGFNYMLLSERITFDNVHLKDDDTEYMIPKEDLGTHGVFLFFKQQGFERQIFVTLEILKQYTIKTKAY